MSHHHHRLCIAPMMGCTDRHQRMLMRHLSRYARLYTEMVTADAVIHGDRERLLGFDAFELPLALQLGGHDPARMARAAQIGEQHGYTEINLNIGCPSERVQSGRFGACLMAEPDTVAACVSALRESVCIPITVKCRIGIDDQEPETLLPAFIDSVAAAGCDTFIVHARKAILGGLSPKQNRDIPPLNYPLVSALKECYPHLNIVVNGGITTLDDALKHLNHVDGVMIGRAAWHHPWRMAEADRKLFNQPSPAESPHAVVESLFGYMEEQLSQGTLLLPMVRCLLPLFEGRPGARAWRRHLSENAWRPGAGPEVVKAALAFVTPDSERLAA